MGPRSGGGRRPPIYFEGIITQSGSKIRRIREGRKILSAFLPVEKAQAAFGGDPFNSDEPNEKFACDARRLLI
jgi:hypothetical protein